MPTYIQDMDYTLHAISRVTHKLKVVEEADVPKKQNLFTFYIIRTNSGKEADGGDEHVTIKINGNELRDGHLSTPKIPANSTEEILVGTYGVPYAGSKSFKISVNYRCDNLDKGAGLLDWATDWIWGTYASVEVSGNVTPIDLSPPSISNLSAVSDRYGLNASVSFNASHSTYPITSIKFKFSRLTGSQAFSRSDENVVGANYIDVYATYDRAYYYIICKKLYNLTNSNDIFFNLKPVNADIKKNLLNSGESYPYELTVTAYNGETCTLSGELKVPQKVTGVTCEPQIDLLPGESSTFDYQVHPGNAEEQSVKFNSTDKDVATVNDQGVVTAVSEGGCHIIVTTVDGGSPDAQGFTAHCAVNVINNAVYPALSEIRYLSNREITRISAACIFLREKLIEKGVSVPELSSVTCEGKSHPVKEILSILETINSNCYILKNASDSIYSTDYLSDQRNFIKQNIEMNWYTLVNEWVHFLNQLNEKI